MIYQAKNGLWAIRYELPGSTQQKRLKKQITGFATEADAKAAHDKIDAQKMLGLYKTFAVDTVSDVLDKWHDEHVLETCRHDSILFYENYIKIIKKDIGKYDVSAIRLGHIQSFYKGLAKKGQSQSNIKKVHTTLRAAFYYCYSMEYIPEKFMDKVKLSTYTDVISRPNKQKHWNYEEISTYLPMLKDSPIYFNIHMALYLGLRAEETAGIHISDIDFDNGTITIRHAMKKAYRKVIMGKKIVKVFDANTILTLTKNTKQNVLPLTTELISFLHTHIRWIKEMRLKYGNKYNNTFDGYLSVFPNGNIIADKRVTGRFSTDMDRIIKGNPKATHITFHGLRHSCASWLITKGVDLITVQEILNHSDIKITSIYTHSDLTRKQNALKSLNS